MAFRTILTVTGIDQDESDLTLVAGLGREVDAHMSVFVVALAAPPPIGEYAAMVSDGWAQERQDDLMRLKRRTHAVSDFLAGLQQFTDVSSDYIELDRADENIGRRARYADLTVIGPAMLAGDVLKDKIIEGVLFHSGKPLLVVPEGGRPSLKPRRVMVGWDPRIEASRAVAAARDMLITADEVRLTLVDPVQGETGFGAEPGADAATYLARSGAKVSVDRLPSEGKSVASVLKCHAVDCAAEMLIMGAYGHSRLRQRILGGVTRSMIDAPPLPILMAR